MANPNRTMALLRARERNPNAWDLVKTYEFGARERWGAEDLAEFIRANKSLRVKVTGGTRLRFGGSVSPITVWVYQTRKR